jgi:hypothetical protein
MARQSKIVRTCDRCLRDTEATSLVAFCHDRISYELDLCELHEQMFDSDLMGWARLAREVKTQPHAARKWVPGARFAEKVVIPTSVARTVVMEAEVAGAPALPRDADEWHITEHAKERMAERGVSVKDALWAAAFPDSTRPGDRPGLTIHRHGDTHVVVAAHDKTIVTVARKAVDDVAS